MNDFTTKCFKNAHDKTRINNMNSSKEKEVRRLCWNVGGETH